ncbi:hypothetical protein llap_14977 [Limosa lapponica baueri]|uniref:Uncharacterized protein n=1 Tax=Limosa lapponica baueri TaxID=1758121 RepID=A0A2I0TLM8_LIMLA|nr:hypothetical protein llap_14977 [Limosa lapponica baueri]
MEDFLFLMLFTKMINSHEIEELIYVAKLRCLEWLLNNLMTHQSVELFKELSINLMKQLISSSNLFVMQVEMDVYTALKKEEVVMNLDSRLLIFPLYICCNFLYTSPEKKADSEALPDNSET